MSGSRLSNLQISALNEAHGRIDWTYMPDDHMLGPNANHQHYREVGESALRCISASIMLANVEVPAAILDFGCGSGRITRWLKAVFPSSQLVVSDVRADSLAFLERQFGATPWLSSPDFSALSAPMNFDLIWSGSVVTHLSEEQAMTLIHKFHEWLNIGGICVFTTHGKRMLDNMKHKRIRYMPDEQQPKFLDALEANGYAYYDFTNQPLGNSANTLPWIIDRMGEMGCRLINISEAAWDRHQDVVCFQRVS